MPQKTPTKRNTHLNWANTNPRGIRERRTKLIPRISPKKAPLGLEIKASERIKKDKEIIFTIGFHKEKKDLISAYLSTWGKCTFMPSFFE
jgi:hypothetical protein